MVRGNIRCECIPKFQAFQFSVTVPTEVKQRQRQILSRAGLNDDFLPARSNVVENQDKALQLFIKKTPIPPPARSLLVHGLNVRSMFYHSSVGCSANCGIAYKPLDVGCRRAKQRPKSLFRDMNWFKFTRALTCRCSVD